MTIDETTIEDAAKAPLKVSTDEGTVVEKPIDELIKADQYSRAKQVSDNPLHGLRITRCKPGGPV